MGGSFYCDCCSETISKKRWHCTQCPDFDLCRKCHKKQVFKDAKSGKWHVTGHVMTIHYDGPTDQERYNFRLSFLKELKGEEMITEEALNKMDEKNRQIYLEEITVCPDDGQVPPEVPPDSSQVPPDSGQVPPESGVSTANIQDRKLSLEALMLLEMLDKSEDLTLEQLQKLWDKYDVDKNGVLDRDEANNFFRDLENATVSVFSKTVGSAGPMGELLSAVTDVAVTISDADPLKYAEEYKKLDKDRNGTIDFNEFKLFLKEQVQSTAETRKASEAMKDVANVMNNCAQQ